MDSHRTARTVDCDPAEEALRAAVYGLFRALRDGDAEAAAAHFAADATRTVYALCSGAPHAGQYTGRDAITEQLTKICTKWQTLEHRFDALNVDGDRAFARIQIRAVDRSSGTHLQIDETNVFQNSIAGFVRLETFVEAVRIEQAEERPAVDRPAVARPIHPLRRVGDGSPSPVIDPA